MSNLFQGVVSLPAGGWFRIHSADVRAEGLDPGIFSVAEFINTKKVYPFSSRRDHLVPKSVTV